MREEDRRNARELIMKLGQEDLTRLYTDMVRVRKLDEQLVRDAIEGTELPFYHSQHGQEAVGVGAVSSLKKDDYVLYGHRGHGISKLVPKGVSARSILAEHYGKTSGSCKGLSRFHVADLEFGLPGISGTLGGDFVIASGLGIAAKMRGEGQVILCIQGEGTYARGTFHETIIMAANWRLPIVYVVENNLYMGCTPMSEVYRGENFADLAKGYGIPGEVADGQDVVAVHEAIQGAVERARNGEGPSLIEFKTYRIRSHAEGIPDLRIVEPRPQEEIDAWAKRDPIDLFREKLLGEGVLSSEDVERINKEAAEEVAGAARQAVQDAPAGSAELDTALYAE